MRKRPLLISKWGMNVSMSAIEKSLLTIWIWPLVCYNYLRNLKIPSEVMQLANLWV
jgi:hypothetical protein